jgi:hypothetical protein
MLINWLVTGIIIHMLTNFAEVKRMDVFYVLILSHCSQGDVKFDGSVMMRDTKIVDIFYRLCPVSIIFGLRRMFDHLCSSCSNLLSLTCSENCLVMMASFLSSTC